jgi:hypothetical protein
MEMLKQMLVAFFIAPICLNVPVHAQDDADVRRELEVQYKKLAEAHDRRDLKAISALKTSDSHALFPDGRVGDSKLMEQPWLRSSKGGQIPRVGRQTSQSRDERSPEGDLGEKSLLTMFVTRKNL